MKILRERVRERTYNCLLGNKECEKQCCWKGGWVKWCLVSGCLTQSLSLSLSLSLFKAGVSLSQQTFIDTFFTHLFTGRVFLCLAFTSAVWICVVDYKVQHPRGYSSFMWSPPASNLTILFLSCAMHMIKVLVFFPRVVDYKVQQPRRYSSLYVGPTSLQFDDSISILCNAYNKNPFFLPAFIWMFKGEGFEQIWNTILFAQ